MSLIQYNCRNFKFVFGMFFTFLQVFICQNKKQQQWKKCFKNQKIIFQVQKLNDANGIGTPGRKLKTKTQKTKNQLKNLLTPRTAKGSKLISR